MRSFRKSAVHRSSLQSTVCFDGATSEPFPVSSGMKQGCVLAPTLLGIFFSMLLQYAFAVCLVRFSTENCAAAWKVGRPLLRYKDTIKHDLKAVKIKTNSWEDTTANCDAWRLEIKTQVLGAGDNGRTQAASKRVARKLRAMYARTSTAHVCPICQQDCHSRIGLLSHSRSCRS